MISMTKLPDMKLENIDELMKLIKEFSEEHIRRYGVQEQSIFRWTSFATEEFGEFVHAINSYHVKKTGTLKQIINEGIQASTLILKIVEIHQEILRLSTSIPGTQQGGIVKAEHLINPNPDHEIVQCLKCGHSYCTACYSGDDGGCPRCGGKGL